MGQIEIWRGLWLSGRCPSKIIADRVLRAVPISEQALNLQLRLITAEHIQKIENMDMDISNFSMEFIKLYGRGLWKCFQHEIIKGLKSST